MKRKQGKNKEKIGWNQKKKRGKDKVEYFFLLKTFWGFWFENSGGSTEDGGKKLVIIDYWTLT